MFPKGKFNTNISQNAQYVALFRSSSDRKQIGIVAERCLTKIAHGSCQLIFKKRKEQRNGTERNAPSDKQVLSDVFGSCRRYLTITSSAKSDETVIMTSYNENIACEARSAVKSPPVVKSSPLIAKTSWPFPFYSVWSEVAYPIVQNYMQGAP